MGVALGSGIGAAMDNLPMGISMGVAIGAASAIALGGSPPKKKTDTPEQSASKPNDPPLL